MGFRLDGVTGAQDAAANTQTDGGQGAPAAPLNQPATPTDDGASRVSDGRFTASLIRFQLFRADQANAPRLFDNGGGGGTPPVDPRKVDAAVDLIKEKLDESGLFNDVTHSELQDIERTISGLNSGEAKAVFDRLSDADLRKWVDELGSNGWFGTGGYGNEGKQQLFDMLAGKLDGHNLARLSAAMSGDDVKMFGRAVAAHGSDAAKEAFIREAAARATTDEATGVAVAEVIGSMRNNPAALQRALGALSPSQINAIAKAATQEEIHTQVYPGGGGGAYITIDARPLARMLDAVAKINDPRIKAQVFEAGAAQLKNIEESGNLLVPAVKDGIAQVRDGLTRILQSDTNGVVGALEQNYRDGHGISAYLKSMIGSGQTQAVGELIATLQTGNNRNQNAVERFGQMRTGTDGRPYYDNAENLGYFVGGVHSAVKDISGDRDKQANLLKTIFGAALGAIGAKDPVTGVVASALNGITSTAIDAVTDSLKNGDKKLLEALRELAFPHGADGEAYEGAAETAYDSAVGRVIDANP